MRGMKYVLDSRQVKPGMGFVALKGERVDGRDYIPFHCHVVGERPKDRPLFVSELKWSGDGWPYVESLK